MSFVIFDTEYTSWKGCLENGWRGNQKKEVVQISALRVSENLEVMDEFSALCQPAVNPVLSEYFTNLTGITNEQLEKQGMLFAKVYKKFEEFAGTDVCYSHGWGSDYFNKSDGEILEENICLYKLTKTKELIYRNVAPVFKQLYLENGIIVKSQSSGQIAGILGLEENLKHLGLNPHNALYDVYSIFEGLKYFYPKSVELLEKFQDNREK